MLPAAWRPSEPACAFLAQPYRCERSDRSSHSAARIRNPPPARSSRRIHLPHRSKSGERERTRWSLRSTRNSLGWEQADRRQPRATRGDALPQVDCRATRRIHRRPRRRSFRQFARAIPRRAEEARRLGRGKKPVTVTRSHPCIAISGKAAILRPAHVVETFSDCRAASPVASVLQSSETMISSGGRVCRRMLSMAFAIVAAPL